MIESEKYLTLITGGLPEKGGLKMRYEKPTAETVYFDSHELFMAYSNGQCNSYNGTECTQHAVGSGLCIGYDGTKCNTFTFTETGFTCFSFREGLCGFFLDDPERYASCSIFTCNSFP